MIMFQSNISVWASCCQFDHPLQKKVPGLNLVDDPCSTCAQADWVTFFRSSWAPVVIFPKKTCSATRPPSIIHILSNSCSRVYRYCSLGRYWAQPKPFPLGMMDTQGKRKATHGIRIMTEKQLYKSCSSRSHMPHLLISLYQHVWLNCVFKRSNKSHQILSKHFHQTHSARDPQCKEKNMELNLQNGHLIELGHKAPRDVSLNVHTKRPLCLQTATRHGDLVRSLDSWLQSKMSSNSSPILLLIPVVSSFLYFGDLCVLFAILHCWSKKYKHFSAPSITSAKYTIYTKVCEHPFK